jgi:hypothetical protein
LTHTLPQDDGSALFVTVARYRTPSGADIDLRGILPDMGCAPPLRGGARPAAIAIEPAAGAVAADSPAAAAVAALDDGDDAPELDRCLLTALDALSDSSSSLMEATATGAANART